MNNFLTYFLFLQLLLTHNVFAEISVIELTENTNWLLISDDIEYFEDASAEMSIENILDSSFNIPFKQRQYSCFKAFGNIIKM